MAGEVADLEALGGELDLALEHRAGLVAARVVDDQLAVEQYGVGRQVGRVGLEGRHPLRGRALGRRLDLGEQHLEVGRSLTAGCAIAATTRSPSSAGPDLFDRLLDAAPLLLPDADVEEVVGVRARVPEGELGPAEAAVEDQEELVADAVGALVEPDLHRIGDGGAAEGDADRPAVR